ncbi:hypothetical protein HID58_057638, partial [Brassica napus]
SVIDLNLTIADLFIPGTHRWDESLVRRTFTVEDAELILKIRPNHCVEDFYKWGLTKDGSYSSQSGYRSTIKLPQGGFSRSSVFLNIYHLLIVNDKKGNEAQNNSFIWIMWQICKGRNELIFARTQTSPVSILSKALEEASIWFAVNTTERVESDNRSGRLTTPLKWSPPPVGSLKCNVGIAWERPNGYNGASWILRDHMG